MATQTQAVQRTSVRPSRTYDFLYGKLIGALSSIYESVGADIVYFGGAAMV